MPVKDQQLELLEIVLMKASGLSFKRLMKFLAGDAYTLAVITASMVCQHWWRVLTS
jgi:lipopolysaccharide export LptBFGC system permease protein LptF